MTGRRRADWAVGRAVRHVATRFRQGSRLLPRETWRRWRRTLALGYLGVVAITVGLVEIGRTAAGTGLLDRESGWLQWLATRSPLSFSHAVWIQTIGTDITLVLVVLFAAGSMTLAGMPLRALSVLAAFVMPDLAVRLAWILWSRPRPDLVLDGVAAPGFASYPSGHTAKSVAIYGLLAYFWARSSARPAERTLAAALALLLVLLVAAGRMRMGVHWPSDILAGALIGAAWLAVLALALTRAERDPARRAGERDR